MRKPGVRRWLQLAAGLAAVALVIVALHLGVGRARGPFGRIWSANLASGVNANAFFYTEVGTVGEFVDGARGRYAAPPRPRPAALTTSSDATPRCRGGSRTAGARPQDRWDLAPR